MVQSVTTRGGTLLDSTGRIRMEFRLGVMLSGAQWNCGVFTQKQTCQHHDQRRILLICRPRNRRSTRPPIQLQLLRGLRAIFLLNLQLICQLLSQHRHQRRYLLIRQHPHQRLRRVTILLQLLPQYQVTFRLNLQQMCQRQSPHPHPRSNLQIHRIP